MDVSKPDLVAAGQGMHALATRLFPLHRSLTGTGLRESLRILAEELPLEVHEVPTGTRLFDWEVPKEWVLGSAFIADADGKRVVDVADSNLHLVAYSAAVDAKLSWSELASHLYTAQEMPSEIPYRVGYFDEDWGFCISHERYRELEARGEQTYRVRIDARFVDGALSYGEVLLPGRSDEEVLFSAHLCHPSLANDNLSGVVCAAYLARALAERDHRLSYRFVFAPATLGAIAWLARNEDELHRVRHGLVLSGVGDPGASTYKRSRRGTAKIDRVMARVLAESGEPHTLVDFAPFGHDERQYCSPGIDLPMGCLMRTPDGQYPEYHTSADDLEFVRPEYLADSWAKCLAAIDMLERDGLYRNTNSRGEPQLGRRGLYAAFGRSPDRSLQQAVQWVLSFSDGEHGLLDIADRAGLSFAQIRNAADLCLEHELLAEVES